MNLVKGLILGGLVLIVIGALIWLGLPLGKFPGDIHIKGGKTQIYFPIATCVFLSVVLTLVLKFLSWITGK